MKFKHFAKRVIPLRPLLLLACALALLPLAAGAQTAVYVPSQITDIGGLSTALATENGLGPVIYATPGALKAWRLALAKVRDGQSDAKILCLGDSITYGTGGTNTATAPYKDGYPRRLASLLSSYAVPASLGYIIPQNGYPDDRWSVGAGWTIKPYGPTGQACWGSAVPTTGNLVITPGVNADTYDVYYIATPSTATMVVTATGGSTSTVNTSGSNTIQKATVTAASASTSNTVTISGSGSGASGVLILGVEPSLSTTRQVRVADMGLPGASASAWATGGLSYSNGISLIAAYAPHLTILCLGVNDAGASATTSAFSANLLTLITAAKAAGSVIILTPPPSLVGGGGGVSSAQGALEAAYEAAFPGIALANGCVLVDWWGRLGGVNDASFMGSIHPNNLGYWDVANMLYNTIRR